jgi:hypothetical protein
LHARLRHLHQQVYLGLRVGIQPETEILGQRLDRVERLGWQGVLRGGYGCRAAEEHGDHQDGGNQGVHKKSLLSG